MEKYTPKSNKTSNFDNTSLLEKYCFFGKYYIGRDYDGSIVEMYDEYNMSGRPSGHAKQRFWTIAEVAERVCKGLPL